MRQPAPELQNGLVEMAEMVLVQIILEVAAAVDLLLLTPTEMLGQTIQQEPAVMVEMVLALEEKAVIQEEAMELLAQLQAVAGVAKVMED